MVSLLAATSAAASALGTYNIARYVATTAIEKRRKVKEARELADNVKAAIKFAKGAYEAVSDGISPEEAAKAKAIASAVKAALSEVKSAKYDASTGVVSA